MKKTSLYYSVIAIVTMMTVIAIMVTPVAAAEDTAGRYAGSFIIETYDSKQYYWYVHPETEERYALNTAHAFSRLLKNVSEGIMTKDLERIPTADAIVTDIDYNLTDRFAGHILLQVDNNGQAWYVNPLDRKRYDLANGKEGFETAKQLALDISRSRLVEINITKALGFDHVTYTSHQIQTDEGFDFDDYDDMFDLIRKSHLRQDSFTDSDLFYGSLKGMIAGTGDIHSEYYTPEENKQQQSTFRGESSIEGIGAVIDARDDSIFVIRPLSGTPAATSGLKPGDQIVEVDGVSTNGISIDRAVSLISGPAGTTVVLKVYREADRSTRSFSIVRAKVDIPAVEGELLDNSIAYFQFSLFTYDLVSEFQKLVDTLVTSNTTGIIVDMRYNIGGVTQSSTNLADYWLDQGDLIFTEQRPTGRTEFVASMSKPLQHIPTVVLVNGETASASEIFTGAVRHHGEATVIGTQTFGKGTGQNLFNFANGAGLKFTTFEWLLPDDESIDGVGITPDIVVEDSVYGDAQLDRALSYLRQGY